MFDDGRIEQARRIAREHERTGEQVIRADGAAIAQVDPASPRTYPRWGRLPDHGASSSTMAVRSCRSSVCCV